MQVSSGAAGLMELYAQLPDGMRRELREDGEFPGVEVLAYLCEDELDEMGLSMKWSGTDSLTLLLAAIREMALQLISRRVKRRVRLTDAEQRNIAQKQLLGQPLPATVHSVLTLKQTGAVQECTRWSTGFKKSLQLAADPHARQALESAERCRWIKEMVLVLR